MIVQPLRIVVLGASGATGQQLVSAALERGHDVHAVVRNPATYTHAPSVNLTVHRGDAHDSASIAAVVTPDSIVLSGLGLRSKKDAGTLTAGARAVIDAEPANIVWLGAIGTGQSAAAVGRLTHRLLRIGFGPEYADKTSADGLILDAGGTVVHSGPLNDKDTVEYDAIPLTEVGRRFFPAFVPRAGVATTMIGEAETNSHPGLIVVPVLRRTSGHR